MGGAQHFTNKGDKEAVKATFDEVGLDPEKYRVGKTKVFFRAGVLGEVEEIRDEIIGKMVCLVQNWVRGYMGRKKFVTMQEQRVALTIVQRNIKKYIGMKNWIWFYLWVRVKPIINKPRIEDAIKEIKVRSDASVAACKEAEDKAIFLENQHGQLITDIQSLKEELEATAGNAASFMDTFAVITAEKDLLEKKLQDTCYLVDQEIEGKNEIAVKIKDVDVNVANAKHDLEALEDVLLKLTREKETKDHNIRVINDVIAYQEEV